MLGETKQNNLVNYGIQNEGSDIRAHVGVLAKTVFVYPTAKGLLTIQTGRFREAPAYQSGIMTAMGYLVPPKEIPNLKRIAIPKFIMDEAAFSPDDDLSTKGNKAVRVVVWLLKTGNFPLSTRPEVIQDADLQISGLDIMVSLKARIQVKCDYNAGEKSYGPGCTGNLYLQFAERNIYGIF